MSDCAANCPFCNSVVKFSTDLLNTIILCPNCNGEVCFFENDILEFSEAEKRKKEANEREAYVARQREIGRLNQQKKQERAKTEYRFVVLAIEDVEKKLNNLWINEGWQVVSQSTVFLSELSAGLGGISAGARTEGIAYTLKREKNI